MTYRVQLGLVALLRYGVLNGNSEQNRLTMHGLAKVFPEKLSKATYFLFCGMKGSHHKFRLLGCFNIEIDAMPQLLRGRPVSCIGYDHEPRPIY
jgi:hypothetical protein